MDFQALLDQLPNCPGPNVLPIVESPIGFRYVAHGLPEFVGPDLTLSTEIDQPPTPRIMIISAAGAVGKSTLAKEIAARKQSPIWDLARALAARIPDAAEQVRRKSRLRE
jgi:hypothetical protein